MLVDRRSRHIYGIETLVARLRLGLATVANSASLRAAVGTLLLHMYAGLGTKCRKVDT